MNEPKSKKTAPVHAGFEWAGAVARVRRGGKSTRGWAPCGLVRDADRDLRQFHPWWSNWRSLGLGALERNKSVIGSSINGPGHSWISLSQSWRRISCRSYAPRLFGALGSAFLLTYGSGHRVLDTRRVVLPKDLHAPCRNQVKICKD